MRNIVVSAVSTAVLFGTLATAGAENKAETFTVTPFVGGYSFDGEQHLKTKPVFGLRGGYNFTDHIGTELVFDWLRTDGTKVEADTNVYNYHLDLLYHFFPWARAVPFIMAGVGGTTLDGATTGKTRVSGNGGVGIKYNLTENLHLRGEVRDVFYRYDEENHNNIEYGIGLGFVFGGAHPAPKPVVAAAVEPAPAPAPKPAPTAPRGSISATPSSVLKGSSATIAWDCLDADSAEIQPEIGKVAPHDSRIVTVTDSTDYTVTCSGPGGKATSTSRISATEPPRPSCSMTATPDSITEGQSARLDWECTNATTTEIQPGAGAVESRGSRTVTPSETATYSVTGSGAGTSTASATIKVTLLPPETRSITLNVQFDTGKAEIKKAYDEELARVAAFLKEYPGLAGTVEGHTDNVGSHDVNVRISQKRAEAVRNYLVKKYGINASRLKAVGYGPDKPIADNKTAEGRTQNRRVVAGFETVVVRKK